MRQSLGFDRPIIVQYLAYLADLAQLDLGVSRRSAHPGMSTSSPSAFPTPWRSPPARSLVALGIGIPAGIVMAVWRGSWLDRDAGRFVLTGQSMPTFSSGILLILLFGVLLRLAARPRARRRCRP